MMQNIFSIYLILATALGFTQPLNRNEFQKQENNVSGELNATGV
jgi:hypothetical protein